MGDFETAEKLTENLSVPRIIDGGVHVDARGVISFVNDFQLAEVERMYAIRAHQAGQQRGWVGHQREQKWFWVVQGAVIVAAVKPDNWEFPKSNLTVERYFLSDCKTQVLHVPSGFATGSVGLTDHAITIVFSTGTIDHTDKDDYRFPVDTWPIQS